MPERLRTLLDHIVAQYVVRDELRSIDLDAPPSESGAAIESDKREVARRETERADELASAFRAGLGLAYRARGTDTPDIVLDDRDPTEDRIADALIRFLVSHDLATSRTEETDPLHYLYHVTVDWARLSEVAGAAGIDLDDALQRVTD